MENSGVGAERYSIKPLSLCNCAIVCSVCQNRLGNMQAALVLTFIMSGLLSALAQKPHHCSKSNIMTLPSCF